MAEEVKHVQLTRKVKFPIVLHIKEIGHAGHIFPADLLDPTHILLYLSIGAVNSCISG